MKVVEVDKKIIEGLRHSELSREMKSLEFCKFLIIEESPEKIIGASGIGGILNVHSLQIDEKYQGKGLGKKLFKENIEEAKRRGYSFILLSRNPENIGIVKLHTIFGFKPLFRIHYSSDVISEALILPLKFYGKIITKTLRIFNTKFGIILLAILLKLSKRSFTSTLTLSPDDFPNANIKYIISNFEKIN